VNIYGFICLWLVAGFCQSGVADEREKDRHTERTVKLEVEFLPAGGEADFDKGKLIVSYIPENAVVSKNGNVEVRADVVIRTQPRIRHRCVGRLTSTHGDVTFIPSARIVTDGNGVFHVTLRSSLNDIPTWDFDIHPAKRKGLKFQIDWEN
jgi:hypothetical protein